jgi:hypothetical protein
MNVSRHRRAAVIGSVPALMMATLLATAGPARAAAKPRFDLTTIAAPGQAIAINSRGDVLTENPESFVVESYIVRRNHAAIELWGDAAKTEPVTASAGLSDAGVSIGTYRDSDEYGNTATWSRAGVKIDAPIYPGTPGGYGNGPNLAEINSNGEMVGSAYDPAFKKAVPTRWSAAGKPSPVDPTDADVLLTGINDDGIIAGRVNGRAALLEPHGRVLLLQQTANLDGSAATGVSDSGMVFGYGEISGVRSSGGTIDLVWNKAGRIVPLTRPAGTISATAVAGNQNGILVGNAIRSDGTTVAVEWRTPSRPVVLPQLAPARGLYQASAINNHGVVVGAVIQNPGSGGYYEPLEWTPHK